MEVVYFFIQQNFARVPFTDYDRRLFLFFVSRGGSWNRERREFVFGRGVKVEKLSRELPGVPFARVEENPAARSKIDYITNGSSFPLIKFGEEWQIKLEDELLSRKYSPRTLLPYVYYNKLLCQTLLKTPEEILPEHITQFLALMEKKREYSASSINLAISAVKFFYGNVCVREKILERHRPRQDKKLPVILDKSEIAKILCAEKNPKHRLLLMLAYSSGLRVSEVVALKKEHIDLARRVIFVRLGKGRKDRFTLLSEKAAGAVAAYITLNAVETWIFTGQPVERHLSIRSAQSIFDKAVRRVKINKEISIHSLRHSFATHLLESGIDIKYIQTLLGHANLKTTERYTHVARGSILNIKSPLDTIP